MSDENENQSLQIDELAELKARADLLGISYHPNIGVDTLRERVNAAVNSPAPAEEPVEKEEAPVSENTEQAQIPAPSALAAEPGVTATVSADALAAARAQLLAESVARSAADAAVAAAEPVEETKSQRRYCKRREATALVRVNVMNMNPFRKEWEGDTYTVGNNVIGTIKRYVPYGVDWHVEKALLDVMQERQCQVWTERKDQRTGQMVKTARFIKELQIAILPPLTEQELKDLAQRQAMAAGSEE